MKKGYKNRWLHIDLGSQNYTVGTTKDEIFEEFIGGKGLGLKLMVDEGLVTHDAYAPENPLIFVTGPFTGSLVQTSARSALVTKSPLTNTFLDSHIGGHFGPMIKRAGYDYVFITGHSKKPINNSRFCGCVSISVSNLPIRLFLFNDQNSSRSIP